MTFESDSLIDRRRLKRRLGLWRIAAVIAVAGTRLARSSFAVASSVCVTSRPGSVRYQ